MNKSADRDAEDPDRALRRRRFLTAGGGLVLGGLLTGCNFSHGSGAGNSSTTAPATGPSGSKNPLSGSSGNSSS